MKKAALFLVLGFLAVTSEAQTKTRKCRSFRQLKSDEVSVSNCQGGICKLKRGTDAAITLKFKSPANIKDMTTNVQATIGGFPFPFVGVDGVSACGNIYDEEGKKVGCPLEKGKSYVYKNSFRVLDVYPRIQLLVHWALTTGGKDVMCFEIDARIV